MERSFGKLADAVPEASHALDEEVAPTALPDSLSCGPSPQPVSPPLDKRRDGHSHLTVHTLLPDAVIQDSLAALESYYGVPGCTHSPANAAEDAGAEQPTAQCKSCQQQLSSWCNVPRMSILSLSLPSDAPCNHTPRLGHDSASQEPNLSISSSCKRRLPCPGVHGRHHDGALGAATALSTAATAATTGVMAQVASMGTSDIQRPGHDMLTLPNRLPESLPPHLERHRQAGLVGRHHDTTHAGRSTLALCHSADTNNNEVCGQTSSSNSVSDEGQTTAPWRNNSSSQADVDSGTPAAFGKASSINGLAQWSSSCKRQASSPHAAALSCQDKSHISDLSAVAADVAALSRIPVDQPAGRAFETAQDILHGSTHLTTASDSRQRSEQLVQPRASSPVATQTAAVSCKSGVSQKLQMRGQLNDSLSESPRGSRQPILIDSPRPVCSPRGQGTSVAAAHSTSRDAKQDKAVNNQPGQQQRRPPGAFVGHDPCKVVIAGGMGLRNSFCFCSGSSVLSESGGGSLGDAHPGKPHAASLIADAAAAGAEDNGLLLRHVLQQQSKEHGGPFIQLAPRKLSQNQVMQTMEPSRAGGQQAADGDALTAWKQPR